MALAETPVAAGSGLEREARGRPRLGVVVGLSLAWIALVVFVALFADLLPVRDPGALGIRTGEVGRFESPSLNAWFGGDAQGRDLFAQTIHATRPVLLLATAVTVMSASLGLLVGLAAGYIGGRTDAVVMAVADVMFAFPSLVLLFAISAIWGISMAILIPVFTVLGIPPYARIVRGVTIALAEREFVDAARALGASPGRIIIKELAPLVALPAVAYAFLGFAIVIATEGALAFLGLGLEQDTWGSLINDGRGVIREAPHLAMIPATVMFVTIMAFNFVGDAVRSVIDPRPVLVAPKRRDDGAEADTPAAGAALASIRDLTTRFPTPAGEVTAVDRVSLDIEQGQTLGIVGESGSGKTMLLRSITGAFPVAGVERRGRVVVDGVDLLTAPAVQRRQTLGTRIGVVSQDPLAALNPVRTVGSQLAEVMRVHRGVGRTAARRRAVDLLGQVGIPQAERRVDQYPHELSGGMRQRVTIALALANEPKLLLADEPTTALDVTIQDQILRLLRALTEERGMALVLVTHDLAVVRGWTDDVAVMYAGQIVEHGPTDVVFAAPNHRYTQALLASTPRLDLPAHSRLTAIAGQPPSLVDLPAGCRFAPRCAHAQPGCGDQPAETVLGSVRYRCWHPAGGEASHGR